MAKNLVKYEGTFGADNRKVINDNIPDVSRVTTAFSATASTTLANVTGLLTDTLQPGVYDVDINLITTAGASGGVKVALKWGTASMITATALSVQANSAAATANTTFTTSTDAASILAGTAAYVNVKVRGTITVALAGTLQLQAAQNVSDAAATTVALGSTMSFTAIGATTPLISAVV
jgi:hypothetical protein